VRYWGDEAAKLIIIGLAPGMKGANRTGRPFTGDYAGDLLYATLLKVGLATGEYRQTPDDTLQLKQPLIANAVALRAAGETSRPPTRSRPAGSSSASGWRSRSPSPISLWGRIAHDQLLVALGEKRSRHPFGHGAEHQLSGGARLFDSYHCSRYNTNTGVLTTEMFEDVVGKAADYVRG